MALIADSPVPYTILNDPRWEIGGDSAAGWGGSLAFHVGKGVPGGSPADIYAFLTFAGGSTEEVVIGGVPVTRIVPLRHPYLPHMVAQRIRSIGTGRPYDGPPGSTDARVMIDFATPPYDFSGDAPMMTRRRRIGASTITMPGQALAVGGVPLNHDAAKHVPEIIYSLTFYNLPEQNDDVYVTLAGKVNSGTFLGRTAETVRFDGLEDEATVTVGAARTYTVTLSLAWRPRSWNHILLPSGVWARPVNVNDGLPIYEVDDFTPLLG